MSKKDFIVGVDIGATKVCCVVGELVDSECFPTVEIIGASNIPSCGVKKGIILDREATILNLEKAVEEAELMAGVEISSVYVAISEDRETIQVIPNIINCSNRAGLKVAGMCLNSIAAGEAVLSAEEMESGVLLIDFGGSTSQFGIFKDGLIVHSGVVPLGGDHITSDVSICMKVSKKEAEILKTSYGRLGDPVLAEIIHARALEILSLIREKILKLELEKLLSKGVVITGGGSLLDGIAVLAEEVFCLPVRKGVPQGVGGFRESIKSPRFSAAVGLLKYGARNIDKTKFPFREQNIYDKMSGSMKTWINDLF